MKSLIARGGCALVLAAIAATPAAAQDVTVCFEGAVQARDENVFDVADPTTVFGQYTFNAQTRESNGSTVLGAYRYRVAPYGMKVRVGEHVFESHPSAPQFSIEVSNDFNIGDTSADGIDLRSFSNVGNQGLHPDAMTLRLNDASGAKLVSTALPVDVLRTGDWPVYPTLVLTSNGDLLLTAEITKFSAGPDCGFPSAPVTSGPQGEKGDQGDPGPKGDTGEKGERGEQGLKGDKGDKGDLGDRGEQGVKGDSGEKGDKGDKGDPGDKGNKGDRGEGLLPGSMLLLPEGSPTPAGYVLLDTFDFTFSDRSRGRRQMLRVDVFQRLPEPVPAPVVPQQ